MFPFLGNSSDGDARRRLLMLEASLQGIMLLQATHFSMKGQYGSLGDQDYIHNLKKMINPLDHISKDIKLGEIVQQHSRIELKTNVL